MQKPTLEEFAISQEDVDWAERTESRLSMCLFVGSAIGWGLWAFLNADSFHPVFVVLAILLGFAFGLLTALFLAVAADYVARFLIPKYRRAQLYKARLTEFRGWWVRTQEEFWCSLSGAQFETELAALFRRAGFRAELTPATGDEGVDIWLQTDQGKEIVQCKARRTPIGPTVARELFGTLQHFQVQGAILASTSGFTRGVLEYVRGKPIKLLGLREIIALQEKTPRSDL